MIGSDQSACVWKKQHAYRSSWADASAIGPSACGFARAPRDRVAVVCGLWAGRMSWECSVGQGKSKVKHNRHAHTHTHVCIQARTKRRVSMLSSRPACLIACLHTYTYRRTSTCKPTQAYTDMYAFLCLPMCASVRERESSNMFGRFPPLWFGKNSMPRSHLWSRLFLNTGSIKQRSQRAPRIRIEGSGQKEARNLAPTRVRTYRDRCFGPACTWDPVPCPCCTHRITHVESGLCCQS